MDSGKLEFTPYDGDLMGLTVTPNHLVFRWNVDHCTILFSIARQGQSINMHLASDKCGLRYLRQALDKFVCIVFSEYEWCRMVVGNVNRPSVGRMIEKIGFKPVANVDGCQVYARLRQWAA